MEGRFPPPPASHPFPDDPTAINRKFWGTQASKGFLRCSLLVGTVWVSLLFLNDYFTRDTKFYGMETMETKEELFKRQETLRSHTAKRSMSLSGALVTVPNLFFPEKNAPQGYDLRFDDNVRLNTINKTLIKTKIDD